MLQKPPKTVRKLSTALTILGHGFFSQQLLRHTLSIAIFKMYQLMYYGVMTRLIISQMHYKTNEIMTKVLYLMTLPNFSPICHNLFDF